MNWTCGIEMNLVCFYVQLHTKFAGVAHVANMQSDQPFQCELSMKGTSVIEGIRQMVEASVMDTELPNYVANIKTLRRNKLLIRPKLAPSGHGWVKPELPFMRRLLTFHYALKLCFFWHGCVVLCRYHVTWNNYSVVIDTKLPNYVANIKTLWHKLLIRRQSRLVMAESSRDFDSCIVF